MLNAAEKVLKLNFIIQPRQLIHTIKYIQLLSVIVEYAISVHSEEQNLYK